MRTTWRRHAPENVVEGGISLVVWLRIVTRGSRTMVALIGATIVCHAQSRDSRWEYGQYKVGETVTGWALMMDCLQVGVMEMDCAAQGV